VGDLRQVFRRELAASEYTVIGESVLQRLLRSGWDLLTQLFRWAFPGGVETGPAPWVSWVLVALGAFALVLVIRAARAPRRADTGALPMPGLTGGPSGSRDWEAWADARAAEGAYREAATGYYQAALKHLDEEGALRFGEWKTPGDYLEELDAGHDRREAFVAFVSDFVSTTFGTGGSGAESVERLARRLKSLGRGS